MVAMAVSMLPKAVSHDGGRPATLRGQAAQQLESIHAGHHQVGDQDVRREGGQLLEGLLPSAAVSVVKPQAATMPARPRR